MSGTLILAIETSNPASGQGSGVALMRALSATRFETLDVELLQSQGRHDDDLMPAIARLCVRTGIQPSDLDRVAVSIGPGGYTGLRVAATTANVIARAAGAQAVGVPTAIALARRSKLSEPLAICLAVKGSSVWVHRFPSGEAGVVSVRALLQMELAGVVGDHFLPDDVVSELEARGVGVEQPHYDPVAVGEASMSLSPTFPVRALYAREPEAVTRWRARHE